MNPLDQGCSVGAAGHVVCMDPSMRICVKMASYNEPSNRMHWKRHGIYKMELIYVQTKVNGQGNPELALEIRKKERKIDNYNF